MLPLTKYAIGVAVVVGVIILLTKWTVPQPTTGVNTEDLVPRLLGQSNEWFAQAEQDENPLLALLHLTIAASKLQTVGSVTSDSKLMTDNQFDIQAFKQKIKALEKTTVAEVNMHCGQLAFPTTEPLNTWFL